MKRTLLCVSAAGLVLLSGCSVLPAGAGAWGPPARSANRTTTPAPSAPDPNSLTTPAPTAETSTPSPEQGTLPVPFGELVTSDDGVKVRLAPPKGYRPGQKAPAAEAKYAGVATSVGGPVSVLRGTVTNDSPDDILLDGIGVYALQDGDPVTDPVYSEKTTSGEKRTMFLPPGEKYDFTYVLARDVAGEWEAEVRGLRASSSDEVTWARYASSAGSSRTDGTDASDTLTQMRSGRQHPTTQPLPGPALK